MMFCNGSPNAPNAFIRCSTASSPNISLRSFSPFSERSCVSIAPPAPFGPSSSRRSCRKRPERNPSRFAGLLVRSHHDLDVAVEAGEESHQTVDRVFTEVALEQAGHFGLADAHELTCSCLRELAFVREPVDFRHDLSLEEMSVGVRQAEIGKDIAASDFHFDFASHHLFSFL